VAKICVHYSKCNSSGNIRGNILLPSRVTAKIRAGIMALLTAGLAAVLTAGITTVVTAIIPAVVTAGVKL